MHGRLDSNGLIIEYPVDNLRARYPNVSLPADLTIDSNLPSGYVYVHESSQPIGAWNQNVLEGDPAQVGDIWVQTWEVQSASEYEQAQRTDNKALEVRNIRNARLTQSDWTQLSDSPADKATWATYRQALRDISDQSGFPWDITWPVEP